MKIDKYFIIVLILLLTLLFPVKSIVYAQESICCQWGTAGNFTYTQAGSSYCTNNGGLVVANTLCDSGTNSETNGGVGLGLIDGLGRFKIPTSINLAGENLEEIVSTIVGFLTVLTGLWFFIIFITGGLSYISAGGESGKLDEARKKMTNGVIGVIIVVAAYSVIFIVGKVLGLDILNPAEIIKDLGPGGN